MRACVRVPVQMSVHVTVEGFYIVEDWGGNTYI